MLTLTIFFASFLTAVAQSTTPPAVTPNHRERNLAELCATDSNGFLGIDRGIAVEVAVIVNFYLDAPEEDVSSILPFYEKQFNNDFGERLLETCATSETNVTDYADIVGMDTFPPDTILRHSNGSKVECVNPDPDFDGLCYRVHTKLTLYVNDTGIGVEAAFERTVEDTLSIFGAFNFSLFYPEKEEMYFVSLAHPTFITASPAPSVGPPSLRPTQAPSMNPTTASTSNTTVEEHNCFDSFNDFKECSQEFANDEDKRIWVMIIGISIIACCCCCLGASWRGRRCDDDDESEEFSDEE